MKQLIDTLIRASAALLLAAMLPTLGGCRWIDDSEGNCGEPEASRYLVQIGFDDSLALSDALPAEVGRVGLFVLDSARNIVCQTTVEAGDLAEAGGLLTLPVAPGTYSLLAWCSPNRANSYTLVDDPDFASAIDCRINGSTADSAATVVDYELDALYHGLTADVVYPAAPGTYVARVALVKDTNRIRVLLQQASGEPLDADSFCFIIGADNGLMRFDNSLLADHAVIYRPYATASGSAEMAGSAGTVINAAFAEFIVGRLTVTDEVRLTVAHRATGEVVVSLPLVNYILMIKSLERSTLSDQEYLDRQDEYDFLLFLDNKQRWLNTCIYVNSWRLVPVQDSML